MADSSQIKNWYLSLFKDFENSLNGEKSSAFHKLRKEAIAKFAELDFPNLHQEEWRFTDMSPILNYNFASPDKKNLPSMKEVSKFQFDGMESFSAVFVNGHYVPELSALESLPGGFAIGGLASAIKKNDPMVNRYIFGDSSHNNVFIELNAAFISDGAFVNIPANARWISQFISFLFHTEKARPFLNRGILLSPEQTRMRKS